MKIVQEIDVWEDDQTIFAKETLKSVDEDSPLGQAQLFGKTTMRTLSKNIEKAMLNQLSVKQLDNMRELIREVIREKEIAEMKAKQVTSEDFPNFVSYSLTRGEVAEVIKAYLEFTLRDNVADLEEALVCPEDADSARHSLVEAIRIISEFYGLFKNVLTGQLEGRYK